MTGGELSTGFSPVASGLEELVQEAKRLRIIRNWNGLFINLVQMSGVCQENGSPNKITRFLEKANVCPSDNEPLVR